MWRKWTEILWVQVRWFVLINLFFGTHIFRALNLTWKAKSFTVMSHLQIHKEKFRRSQPSFHLLWICHFLLFITHAVLSSVCLAYVILSVFLVIAFSWNKKKIVLFASRTSLPVPMFSRNDFNIWSVLKNCIGKELSKITMPVIFNEPLSFLQRMTEYMEYAKLLRIASEQDDPVDRMIHVAGRVIMICITDDL